MCRKRQAGLVLGRGGFASGFATLLGLLHGWQSTPSGVKDKATAAVQVFPTGTVVQVFLLNGRLPADSWDGP